MISPYRGVEIYQIIESERKSKNNRYYFHARRLWPLSHKAILAHSFVCTDGESELGTCGFSEKAQAKGPRAFSALFSSSQQRTIFCSDVLTIQFTLFTLLKNGQVNFLVQISKFQSYVRSLENATCALTCTLTFASQKSFNKDLPEFLNLATTCAPRNASAQLGMQ